RISRLETRLRLVERRRRQQPAAMPFDHTARERQRQAHTSALFVERSSLTVVCGLYAVFFGNDQERRSPAVDLFNPALGDDGALTGLFPQNRSKNRVECVPQPCRVA